MSNAELIAEAREYISPDGYEWTSWWDAGQVRPVVTRLAEALEEAERKIELARAVFADSEEGEDVSNAMDIALA